ncbi:MAG: hypothetical protein K2F81_03815 [Ruminococcus sp.]|nr:hypothetical protein [Ruminococcus sp.]
MENTTCEKKNPGFWKMFAMFMLGMVLGFMFAPIKKGIKICCDNKNSMNTSSTESNCFDDDCFDCEQELENAEWEDETEAYSF